MRQLLTFLILIFGSLGPLGAQTPGGITPGGTTPGNSTPATPAPASTPAPTPVPTAGHLYLELGEGLDLPVAAWQSAYGASYGLKASVGQTLDPHWALQLDLETFYYFGSNFSGAVSDEEVLVIPTVRYQIEGGIFRPYLLGGFGGEFEILSGPPSGATVADFDGAVGTGCETTLYEGFSLFVEGKYNLIFSSKTVGQDMACFIGAHWDAP